MVRVGRIFDTRHGRACRVVLDSGERLLLEHAGGDVPGEAGFKPPRLTVTQTGLFGLSSRRVFACNPDGGSLGAALAELVRDRVAGATPLDALLELVRACASVDDVKARCAALQVRAQALTPGPAGAVTIAQDLAQICLGGHVITTTLVGSPGLHAEFCRRCGARTTTACEGCGARILGARWARAYGEPFPQGYFAGDPAPSFCHQCGAAYPWTEASLNAARELAMELEGLEPGEREGMASRLPDLIADTPRTVVAAAAFKRTMDRAGRGASVAFRRVLIDVVPPAARRILFPG